MKKLKKSVWITAILFIYITAVTLYLAPKNTEISSTEKTVTIVSSYVVLILLWFVLRRKEKAQQRRRDEENQLKNK